MSQRAISGRLSKVPLGDNHPIQVMGIINLTSNSFYSGSVRTSDQDILEAAKRIEANGGAVIDIGARSTAPYREADVPEVTEARLLTNAVKLLSGKVSTPISVDTTRVEVARSALLAGASIINDVNGLTEKDGQEMARLASRKECSMVLCAHERKTTLSNLEPIERVVQALSKSIFIARGESISDDQIVIDPGIGFFSDPKFSNVYWNCKVLSELERLRIFGFPILVGISRKKFIGTILGGVPAEKRMNGSIAAASVAAFVGAHAIRTHDVQETLEAIKTAQTIREKGLRAG